MDMDTIWTNIIGFLIAALIVVIVFMSYLG